MNRYMIETRDLSTSLVFYRALFDLMPSEIAVDRIRFEMPFFQLSISEKETPEISIQPHHYRVDREKLAEVYDRMRRFTRKQQLRESCEELKAAIGLTDPDGNRWIVGDAKQEVEYEKCYIQQLNT